jgi:hypothetical protein
MGSFMFFGIVCSKLGLDSVPAPEVPPSPFAIVEAMNELINELICVVILHGFFDQSIETAVNK